MATAIWAIIAGWATSPVPFPAAMGGRRRVMSSPDLGDGSVGAAGWNVNDGLSTVVTADGLRGVGLVVLRLLRGLPGGTRRGRRR